MIYPTMKKTERLQRALPLVLAAIIIFLILASSAATVWAGRFYSTLRLMAKLKYYGDSLHIEPAAETLPGVSFLRTGVPWRVGIQAGHWQIEQLPSELAHLRSSAGASFGDLTEVELNLMIARRVTRLLKEAGAIVDLLPATVPSGYDADVFVAIHADGANRPGARGWKISAPWRASEAAKLLRDSVAERWESFTGLPEDRYGITYRMRGYYAFSPHRYRHAATATTPSIIIETGFITVASDREVLFGKTERVARGITAGIISYLSKRNSLYPASLVPPRYAMMRVQTDNTRLHRLPGEDEPITGVLSAGTPVFPVNREGDWFEVVVRGNYRKFGWVKDSNLKG